MCFHFDRNGVHLALFEALFIFVVIAFSVNIYTFWMMMMMILKRYSGLFMGTEESNLSETSSVLMRVQVYTMVRYQSCHCRKALRGICSSEYKLSPASFDRI